MTTPAQKQLKDAAAEELYETFFGQYRRFEGPGWWEREKILLPPPARQFRYDLAHSEAMVVVEIQGGLWLGKSGHTTALGVNRDAEKVNFAQYNGWACLQITNIMLDQRQTDPAATFIPLVSFVRERIERLRQVREGIAPEPRKGRLGVH